MTKLNRLLACWVLMTVVSAPWVEAAPEGKDPINFSVDVRGEFTDNRDPPATKEESNFDLYFSPRIDLFIDFERTLIDLYYTPSLRWRSDPSPSQNDSEFLHDFGLNVNHDMTPQTKVRLTEKLDFNDDPSVQSGGFTVRDDRTYLLNRASGRVKHDFGGGTRGEAAVAHMMKRYDDSTTAKESDEDELKLDVQGERLLSPTLALTLRGGYDMYGFESATGLQRDFDVLAGIVGLEKSFSPELRGGIGAGVQAAEYDDPTIDSSTSPFFSANVRVAPNPDSRLETFLTHGIRDADVAPFASQEYTQVDAKWEVDASPSVTVGVSGMYRMSTYDGDVRPAGTPLPLLTGDENTIVFALFGTWYISTSTSLKVFHRYEDIDSDVDVSYSKNTTSLAVHVEL
ncbi:MAG: outer membrane beta-barrel protein [Verrucomicrobia bacterium]|nr:outer membrane beta-barrel protein [Verrucomicrobiota bacterium]